MDNLFTEQDFKKINFLKAQVKSNSFPNQLLIINNDIDKLNQFANLLARFLVCQNNLELNCSCNNCQRINNNTFYDLKVCGDYLSAIKKDEIQEIIASFQYSALEANGKKIYIIRGAELMTPEAANSLLKFLEEPSETTYAILLTKNKNKVLDTIKSRCLNLILNNVMAKQTIEDFKKEFVINFFNSLENNKENIFILVRELFGYSNLDNQEILFLIGNVIKNSAWQEYHLSSQQLIMRLESKKNKLIEICFAMGNLLTDNLNKELVLEKAMIDFYNEVA
ncbi:DNA polymerase III subunit delta' [Spiroplasma syrphidicola EA-1]|uniref:DNA polymerase III subunit delta n=1 Tax=Spiroplasma syrphidicola EA-1 TaxID=1276229 RepID=R4UJX1_9MOLU|nr:DNA polymerase III subunit delta' [Spiroplasma syrphidicola]AGM25606.1 DNA polymerase III subunit delta' [Spiroplasma syrphidicola EA-1]